MPVKKTANTKKTLKATKKTEAPKQELTIEDNLKRLAKSSIPMNFVKKHNGAWNHEDWLCFLTELQEKGYDPIDPDRVGLLLEAKKAAFLSR